MTERRISSSPVTGGKSFGQIKQSLAPVGTVIFFGSETVPPGWRLCDNSSLNVADYPELFALIGYTYGGSGTTFKVPDFRGEFVRGSYSGRNPGTTESQSYQSHDHGQISGSVTNGGTHRQYLSGTLNSSGSNHDHSLSRANGCCAASATNYNTTNPVHPDYRNIDILTNAGGGDHTHSYWVKVQGGSHTHGFSGSISNAGSTETRPINLAVVGIIKV